MTTTHGRPAVAQARRRLPCFGAHWAFMGRTDRELCRDGPAGTGKAVAALHQVRAAVSLFAGARALVSRQTNRDLAASAAATA
jgi:hypothetical protein